MVLDIIIVVIFLICALRGKSQGFLDSLVRLAAISGGVIIGILNTDRLRSLLFALPIDDIMKLKLTKKFNGQDIDLLKFIPKVLRTKFEDFGIDGITTTVNRFTNLSITIISFSIIVGLVWFISVLLRRRILSGRKHKNLLGTVDSSVGLLFGAIKGAILIFLLLALMFPLATLFTPEQIHALNEQLNNSYIAGYLYDVNPLIYFMHKLYI
ncbi:CvpA family protein [Mogibacterium timidum]|uniref:CvpA family protein n=2 Tax=Mogibacterium TaxID=86331 RepID=A0A7Y9B0S1_9FIRM|nr:CvpA family protein [Mogibacterium timidum]NWO22731.1 CvpA family protein [Mogibacterium timidum]